MVSRTSQIEAMLDAWHATARSLFSVHGKRPTSCPFTTTQWLVVHAIARGDATSVTELKDVLKVSSSATTQVVTELVKKGSIVRRPDPDDRRTTRLALSSAARHDLARMRRTVLGRFEKLYAALSDTEFETYMRLQAKIMRKATQ